MEDAQFVPSAVAVVALVVVEEITVYSVQMGTRKEDINSFSLIVGMAVGLWDGSGSRILRCD